MHRYLFSRYKHPLFKGKFKMDEDEKILRMLDVSDDGTSDNSQESAVKNNVETVEEAVTEKKNDKEPERKRKISKSKKR